MYLLDFATFIKQCLPIHWRTNYRFYLIWVLLEPLNSIYLRFRRWQNQVRSQPKELLSVGVLEYELNRIFAEEGYNFFEIDSRESAQFTLLIAPVFAEKVPQVKQYLSQNVPLGIHFNITINS